jgi:hypothetical protein
MMIEHKRNGFKSGEKGGGEEFKRFRFVPFDGIISFVMEKNFSVTSEKTLDLSEEADRIKKLLRKFSINNSFPLHCISSCLSQIEAGKSASISVIRARWRCSRGKKAHRELMLWMALRENKSA